MLAELKAEVVNALIQREGIHRVIEFGCGDGNQLNYMNYGEYLGMDVASSSIKQCASLYASDVLHASTQWVVLYTRLKEQGNTGVQTIQDRSLFHYLFDHPEFKVHEIIRQRYPEQSSADFVILKRSPV